jgi:hypothetical protein
MKILVLLSIIPILVFGPQVIFGEEDLREFLIKSDDSKHIIFAQMEIRNSSEQLVGVIIPRSYYYLDHSLTEKLLDEIPVKQRVSFDNINYEVREIITEIYLQENNHFLDRISLTYDSNTIFYGTELGYVIGEDDKLTTKWKIMTELD